MTQSGPFVLQGDQGYSVKSATKHASHYYSAPFIEISGQLVLNKTDHSPKVVKVSGQAWFDQEWTSQLLDTNTLGWDWISLHLSDGSKLMAFRMRLKDQNDYITGSFISHDGAQTPLPPSTIDLQALSTTLIQNRPMPLEWRLSVPSQNIDIKITAIKEDQWNNALVPYYEGMVTVIGSHEGKGFLELTGY
jgi:predicted secreted hydrolase